MNRKFSDRVGITVPPPVLLDNIGPPLRNSLWNLILSAIFAGQDANQVSRVKFICERFLKLPYDTVPEFGYKCQEWLKLIYYDKSFTWWKIYNLIEFIASNPDIITSSYQHNKFVAEANRILEEESAGYRFVGGFLTPISNKEEIKSIEESISTARARNLVGTSLHFETAIELLAKKPQPDYRNSIKESISGIESLVKQITGEQGSSLDKALTKLDAQVKFHGAFKAGLLSLYGYTSDEDGIRHGILEEREVGFDEAKFMLVACSALVNFIISKASKHGFLSDSTS